jgi:hypothetical protein
VNPLGGPNLSPGCQPGLFLFVSGPASKEAMTKMIATPARYGAQLIQQAHSSNNRDHEEGSHDQPQLNSNKHSAVRRHLDIPRDFSLRAGRPWNYFVP